MIGGELSLGSMNSTMTSARSSLASVPTIMKVWYSVSPSSTATGPAGATDTARASASASPSTVIDVGSTSGSSSNAAESSDSRSRLRQSFQIENALQAGMAARVRKAAKMPYLMRRRRGRFLRGMSRGGTGSWMRG